MKIQTFFLTLSIIVLLCGCAKPAEPETGVAASPTVGSGEGTVKHGPDPSAAQGASYRITPPDPNDPKFKPDPKLAGGN
ncbi:hypothetical protein BH11ARM2_BH11ARM2_19410 [soil metagenome]